jgi:hypothetical protein
MADQLHSIFKRGCAMLLSGEQKKTAEKWLVEKRVEPNCPACKQAYLAVCDFFFGLGRLPPEDRVLMTKQPFMMIGLRCPKCAHVQFFDAEKMGVVPEVV